MKHFYRSLAAAVLILFACISSHAEDKTWYGYYDGSEPLMEFGTGMGEHYDCAIFIPGNVGLASGKSIEKMRITLQGMDGMTGLAGWISTSLPKSAENADLGLYSVDASELSDGEAFEIELAEPLWVPDEGLYVGYSFTATDPFPVLTTSGQSSQPNGFFLQTSVSYPGWRDFYAYKYGNLAIEVLLNGEVYHNAVKLSSVAETIVFPGQTAVLPVEFINLGIDGVTEIEYDLIEDGGEANTFQYVLPAKVNEPKHRFLLELEFPAAPAKGISYKTIRLTKVNGQSNELDLPEIGEGAVITIEQNAPRSTVMEEFTGTWCGWCPRGMVGIENLLKDFGNSFIPIAVHGGSDPMVIEDYADILAKVEGFPSCVLDREVAGDPFYGSTYGLGSEPSYGIRNDMEAQLAKTTPAEVRISATSIEEESINVATSLRLMYPRNTMPPYTVAYVVCADSLRGETSAWWQNNDFSIPVAQKYKDDPYIGWLTEEGARIRDIAYNDVAIAAFGIDKGFGISTSEEWNGDNWVEIDTRNLSLQGNQFIEEPSNLTVVAMIINTQTGAIMNAAKTKLGATGQSLVEEVGAVDSDQIVSIYDLTGRKLPALVKGVNIILYNDGRVRKICIK